MVNYSHSEGDVKLFVDVMMSKGVGKGAGTRHTNRPLADNQIWHQPKE
jgi:hypothetical protein